MTSTNTSTCSDKNTGIISSEVDIKMAISVPIVITLPAYRLDAAVEKPHCGCETSIFKSALRHTITIFAFIVVISFALNTLIHFVGEETLGNLILNKPVIGPLIAGIIGLIPNCASSVVLTQLYIEGVLGLGSLMAGLLAGSGVGILVLFRENDDMKDNFRILAILYVE